MSDLNLSLVSILLTLLHLEWLKLHTILAVMSAIGLTLSGPPEPWKQTSITFNLLEVTSEVYVNSADPYQAVPWNNMVSLLYVLLF